MDVVYAGIPLDIVDTEGTWRKAIPTEDGTDYVHTLWHFELTVVMNPFTDTSLSLQLPATGDVELPQAFIDFKIRHALMQPRQQLIASMWGVPFLITPFPGDLTDAANGPIPISFDVLKVVGDKTLICKYVIEARVNECTPPGGSAIYQPNTSAYVPVGGEGAVYNPLGAGGAQQLVNQNGGVDTRPVIVAQRYKTIVDVDEDYYSTRTVIGKVIFRSDALIRQQITPDLLRDQLAHPIPNNMKRDGIQVVLEPDGLTYSYTFTDHEKPFNFNIDPSIGITRIEAYETQFDIMPDRSEVIGERTRQIGNILRGGAELASAPFTGGLGAAAGAMRLGGVGANLTALSLALMPKYRQHVQVRVWGHRASLRSGLQAIALKILKGRLVPITTNRPRGWAAVSLANLLNGSEFSLTHDLNGKFVEATATVSRGAASTALIGASISFPASDVLFGDGASGGNRATTQSRSVAQTGPPPNMNATAGTHLGLMIAQALRTPCSPPSRPQLKVVAGYERGGDRVQGGTLPGWLSSGFPKDPNDPNPTTWQVP